MSDKINGSQNFRLIFSWAFRLILNLVGCVGIFLIAYELIAEFSNSRWSVLDTIANYLSTVTTIIGTLLTAISIYFYSKQPTPPEKLSIYITAPIAIIACVIALIIFFIRGTLPPHVLNGFAILAIAGALLRIQPNPIRDDRLYWTNNSF